MPLYARASLHFYDYYPDIYRVFFHLLTIILAIDLIILTKSEND